MPKGPKLSLLDAFVLLLVRDGVNTLYLLKEEGGLSLGATSPSLRRLQNLGFVYHEKKGVRGKRKFQVSIMGHGALLKGSIASLAKTTSAADLESIARLVAIAKVEGNLPLAIATLNAGISERRKRAKRSVPASGQSELAQIYVSLVRTCESARLKAEVAALTKLKATLK